MVESAQPGLSHVAREVRAHQRDRFLSTLFAPAERREPLFALYAFDHEIARVASLVSQPMTGLIRLQWWRDALNDLAVGRTAAHPVVAALAAAWPRLGPVVDRLHGAIDAHAEALDEVVPGDLARVEARLEATSVGITLAALAVLDAAEPPGAEVARRIALARGLAERIRAGGAAAKRVTEESDDAAPGERDPIPVAALAERGLDHLRAARRVTPRPSSAAMPALLPGVLAGAYLRRVRRAGEHPTAVARARPPAMAPLTLAWRFALRRP